MKPFSQTLLIAFLLNLSWTLSLAQQDAHAQKLNQFTESALMLFKNRDYKSTIVELKQAIQSDPEDAFAWYVLGLSYSHLRQYQEAVEAVRKSLSLNPKPQWGDVNEKMVRELLAEVEQNARASKVEPPQTLVQQSTPDFETLPPGFTGANPKETVAQFKNIIAGIPFKIDQYSTPTERAQFDQLAAQQFERLGVLSFIYECYKSYDSNAQLFKFNMFPDRSTAQSGLFKYFGLDSATLLVANDNKPVGTYEASNAYGAKRTVIRVGRTVIALAYRARSYLNKTGDEPQSIIKDGSSLYEFIVPMPSAEARENDKTIRCVVLFRPTTPYLANYEHHFSPTINSPTETELVGTALTGRFEQLWVFNQRTGKIYAKFK